MKDTCNELIPNDPDLVPRSNPLEKMAVTFQVMVQSPPFDPQSGGSMKLKTPPERVVV